jgi:hypothetical protein
MYSKVSLKMPLFSIRVRGKWEDTFIFQVVHGRQFRRVASPYDLGPKPHLLPFQPKFKAAVHAWQALPDGERALYKKSAQVLGKPMSGYNRFISLYLKDRLL